MERVKERKRVRLKGSYEQKAAVMSQIPQLSSNGASGYHLAAALTSEVCACRVLNEAARYKYLIARPPGVDRDRPQKCTFLALPLAALATLATLAEGV